MFTKLFQFLKEELGSERCPVLLKPDGLLKRPKTGVKNFF